MRILGIDMAEVFKGKNQDNPIEEVKVDSKTGYPIGITATGEEIKPFTKPMEATIAGKNEWITKKGQVSLVRATGLPKALSQDPQDSDTDHTLIKVD